MAFAPRQRNAVKTAPAHGKAGRSKLKASIATTAQSEGLSVERAPKAPSSASKAFQSTTTTGGSVNPSGTTRRTPLSNTTKTSAKARAVSATPSNNATISASLPRMLQSIPSRTKDPLQVAAQLYPWLYMTSSLEATFQAAELSAHHILDERARDISEKEAKFADQRVRFDAERQLAFFEELASNTLSHELPDIIQTFLRNGNACDKVLAKALQMGTQIQMQQNHSSNLQLHHDILDKLEHTHNEAKRLESSVMQFLDSMRLEAHSPIRPVFTACLPVIRGRTSNLTTAQHIVESSKDNLEMELQLENLRLTT